MNPDSLDTLLFAINTTPEAVWDHLNSHDPEPPHAATRFTQPDALLKAALWYATNGHPVFPCQPGRKQPATRNGYKDATTNPDTITKWWTQHPNYNIGLPTGHAFDVVDLDHVTIGWPPIRKAFEEHSLQPATAISHTPRGLHFYIPATGLGNKVGVYPGVDYRGKGGYVLAPPSITHDTPDHIGGRYRWAAQTWPTPSQLTPHTLPQFDQALNETGR